MCNHIIVITIMHRHHARGRNAPELHSRSLSFVNHIFAATLFNVSLFILQPSSAQHAVKHTIFPKNLCRVPYMLSTHVNWCATERKLQRNETEENWKKNTELNAHNRSSHDHQLETINEKSMPAKCTEHHFLSSLVSHSVCWPSN